ncbi:MAG TPA: choice-of-anchor Q domain-containing protein [Bacteroidales bacterium]|nr:choice-of-anchor Q domain-containing protein [Bacteroidales bacterium]
MRNVLILFVLIICVGCQKETFLTSAQYTLEVSADTIFFDTIFTKKGSITRLCKIYNPHEGTIIVDEISVANQQNLQFFLNVNGISSKKIQHIQIQGGDSIFVFIQAKLQENAVDTAVVNNDSIVLKYNGIQQKIVLQAWGQNVHNVRGVLSGDTVFTSQIPYVIFDSLVVPQGATLTIEAGAKLYMHYNSNIIVHGTLKILGTKDKPVLISNDRLEQTYQLLPGQWGSIIFSHSSASNEIQYATIKNGTNGILITGTSQALVDLKIENSEMYTMSSHIIYALHGNVSVANSVLYNCNYYVLVVMGGTCNVVHSTLYNYGTIGFRNTSSSVVVANYNLANSTETSLQNFTCYNSIIVGQTTNEISIRSLKPEDILPCIFQNCILRDTYTGKDTAYYKNITAFSEAKKLFQNSAMNNFMLDTLSQAKDIGKLEFAQSYEFDKRGVSRVADSKPDVGAYEYVYEKK